MDSDNKSIQYSVRFFLGCLVMLIIQGCNGSGSENTQRDAEQLYWESYTLIKNYTDSLRHAPDSAAVEELSDNFENKIAKINFKYKADADLEMTEQENDTLSRLLDDYVSIKESRLKKFHLASFAIEEETESDSIPPIKE